MLEGLADQWGEMTRPKPIVIRCAQIKWAKAEQIPKCTIAEPPSKSTQLSISVFECVDMCSIVIDVSYDIHYIICWAECDTTSIMYTKQRFKHLPPSNSSERAVWYSHLERSFPVQCVLWTKLSFHLSTYYCRSKPVVCWCSRAFMHSDYERGQAFYFND